ncbi:MAG: short-chain dehydrogenase, partial [Enterovirga sp.]|nr:short-chain dehydrogenase [Enterovirga sp.]
QGGGMSAVDVARLGLDGYEAGRAVVIPGAGNRALSVLSKVVPRLLVRRAAGWLQG